MARKPNTSLAFEIATLEKWREEAAEGVMLRISPGVVVLYNLAKPDQVPTTVYAMSDGVL